MKLKIFTIFDQKAKSHLIPFMLPEIGMATRQFGDACNESTHDIAKHPEDYTLIHIGEFDESTANIVMLDTPEVLGTGILFKNDPNLE